MDERALAERLIGYDTSRAEEIAAAASFIKGWLGSNDVDVAEIDHNGLPVLIAEAGAGRGRPGVPTVILHGHIDVVPGREEQFRPRVEGDRLIGRGAYDMKGSLAAMLCAVADVADEPDVHVRLVCVPDEESDDVEDRSIDALIAAKAIDGDFAITGEPTDMRIGVQAKGVLALRIEVDGTAAHGSTPWLGDNAIHKAHDTFRKIETLPFSRESSDLFDRPSINLARISGGDVFNRVPDLCSIDIDIRYLPNQDAGAILAEIRALGELRIVKTFIRIPAIVSRSNPFVQGLRHALAGSVDGEPLSVGRDGASDAVAFLQAGIPAIEFGPHGAGHHGPDEWVSLESLGVYRKVLGEFLRDAARRAGATAPLRVVGEGPGGVPASDAVEGRTASA